jgi:hypothetical protein
VGFIDDDQVGGGAQELVASSVAFDASVDTTV